MNLLKYFLFLPIIFSTFNVNVNRKNDEIKIQENNVNETLAYSPASEDNTISADLKLEPYYKTDNFTTLFRYYGMKPVKCWTKEDGVYVKLNDKYLLEKYEVEAEIYCYKPKGILTFYVANEKEEVSELRIITRLTDYGVFACTNSEEACDNMVIDYEITNGIISKEKAMSYLDCSYDLGKFLARNLGICKLGKTVVQGKIEWEDWQGKTHPARGLKIQYSETNLDPYIFANFIQTTYCEDDGTYYIEIDNSNLTDSRNAYISIFAATEYTTIGPFIDDITPLYQYYSVKLEKGAVNNENIYIPYNNSFNKKVQIASCIHLAEEYYTSLESSQPPKIHVVYPWGTTSFSYDKRIYLQGHEFENWDTILHEYGHSIEDSLNVFAAIPWSHRLMEDYTGNIIIKKTGALKLAYQEGIASVFSIAIQQTFHGKLTGEYNVGDTWLDGRIDKGYPNTHNPEEDLENIDSAYNLVGEANEQTTTRFLYDLWDIGENEDFDKVNLGNTNFWNLVKNSEALTVSDLVKYIYDNSLIDEDDLGELLEYYHFAPSYLRKYRDSSTRIMWEKNGNVKNLNLDSYNPYGKSFTVGDVFILRFYSPHNVLLFERITNNDFYDISSTDWETIMNQPGSTFKVRIGAKATTKGVTGPYFGRIHEFSKENYSLDFSSIDSSTLEASTTGTISYSPRSFFSSMTWKNVTKITNIYNQEFFCLNAGAASDHRSLLTIRTGATFDRVTFDLIYKNYNARPLDTTIEIHKSINGFWYECAEIEAAYLGMDVNEECLIQTFTIEMGCEADGFEIYVIGYGETAVCVSKIMFH